MKVVHFSLFIIHCLLLSAAASFAGSGGPDRDPSREELERLVEQLGSDDFVERDDAHRLLRDAADLALPFLRRRLNDADAERRLRATDLVKAIESNGSLLRCKVDEGDILAVVFLPGDRRAIAAGTDKTVRLWDLTQGREVRRYTGHSHAIWCLALSPDGKEIASGGPDCHVRRWEVATGEPVKDLPDLPDSIRCLAYTPDGKHLLAACFDGKTHEFDLDTGQRIRTLFDVGDALLSLAISADGKRVLTGSADRDRTVRLWDLATGKELHKMVGHDDRITGVGFLSGNRAVSASQDRTIRVWDLETGKKLFWLAGHTDDINSLAVTPDGNTVLTGGARDDHSIRVWDLDAREELRRFTEHENGVCALAVSASGKQFVSVGRDHSLRLWNMPRTRRR
jgi:WD40 repeat protein